MRADRQPNRRRSGYVLLIVLAVMVLMVTTLAALSKISLRRALAASDAQVRLQQRLGADSIERVVLPQASRVFDRLQAEQDELRKRGAVSDPMPIQLRSAVTIGGVTFDVVIADEDAKLNVNQVYHSVGKAKAETAVRMLLPPSAIGALRLRPAVEPLGDDLPLPTAETGESDDGEQASKPAVPRAFRSWGEVFDLFALKTSIGDDAALPNVTTQITCWGGGGLNVKRASDESIRSAASCVLSNAGANRLVDRYRENPKMTLGILIQQEAKTETNRIRLRKLLGETSTHYSMWIDASATARRSTRVFSVMRKTEDGSIVNERFAF